MQVVFGANGRAGGETARALIARGQRVRVVLHRPSAPQAQWSALGAEVAIANLEDPMAVAAALEGASGAFVLNPPPVAGDPYAQAERTGIAIAEAVRRTNLPKLVALSSIGAGHAAGNGVISALNRIEARLHGAAPAVALLRSGYFIETWSDVADAAIAEGAIPSFLEPEAPVPMVSTIDVGRTAADLLGETWSGTRIVELGGPQDWSANDVAVAFAQVLGRPVTTAFVPPEQRAAVLAQQGIDDQVAAALLGMYDGIAAGRVAREPDKEQRSGEVSLLTAVERIVGDLRQR